MSSSSYILNNNFGNNGQLTGNFSTDPLASGLSNYIVEYYDGSILVVGSIQSSNTEYAISKYTPTGNLDTTFGTGGIVHGNFSVGDNSNAYSCALDDSDGSIYITGTSDSQYAIAKFTSSGNLDTTFGIGGSVIYFFSFRPTDCISYSIVLDKNNNYIYIAGSSNDGTIKYGIAKHRTTDGSRVNIFGLAGALTDYFIGVQNSIAFSIGIDPLGKIVIGGTCNALSTITESLYAIAKFDPITGALDTNFGTGGTGIVTDSFDSGAGSNCFSIAFDEVGNIIIAGDSIYSFSSYKYAIAKYLRDGSMLDPTFNNGNVILGNFIENDSSYCRSLAISSDERIFVGGISKGILNTDTKYGIAEYNFRGELKHNIVGDFGKQISDSPSNLALSPSIAINSRGSNLFIANNILPNGTFALMYYAVANYILYTPTPTPEPTPDPAPIGNVCFVAGTPVKTDSGIVLIENINPEIHTIHNNRITAITKSVSMDKYLVCFEKNSLGKNYPSERTIMSREHKIYYKMKMVEAKEFLVGGNIEGYFVNVHKIKYHGEILYNVLMEKHDKMIVNNLIVETLHPKNIIAKIYMNDFGYGNDYKNKLVVLMNESIKKNDHNSYKKIVGFL
jgi:uncharacterized delta-60 repeat protein